MKYIFTFLIIFFILSSKIHAQDTIIKMNGDTVFARIMEISDVEIKYKNFKYPDGPTYIENKSEIKKINYSNGLKETLADTPKKREEPKVDDYVDSYTQPSSPPNVSGRIEGFDKHFMYKNQNINETEMQAILVQTGDRNIVGLVQQAQQAKGLSNISYGVIPFAIGATIAIPYWFVYAISYNNNWGSQYTLSERNKYGTIAAICVVGTIACPVTGGVFSGKRKFYNNKAIALYNQRY